MDLNTPAGANAAVAVGSRWVDLAAKTDDVEAAITKSVVTAERVLPFAQGFLAGLVDWLEQVIQNTLFPR